MADKKRDIVITEWARGDGMTIWSDHLTADSVRQIVGVYSVDEEPERLVVQIDPRYDLIDIIREVKLLHRQTAEA